MSKYDEIIKQNSGNLSHNVYSEDIQNTSTKLPNYLILTEKETNFKSAPYQRLIPCTCLTKALEEVRKQENICTIFETITSKGKEARYLCDASYGVVQWGGLH